MCIWSYTVKKYRDDAHVNHMRGLQIDPFLNHILVVEGHFAASLILRHWAILSTLIGTIRMIFIMYGQGHLSSTHPYFGE